MGKKRNPLFTLNKSNLMMIKMNTCQRKLQRSYKIPKMAKWTAVSNQRVRKKIPATTWRMSWLNLKMANSSYMRKYFSRKKFTKKINIKITRMTNLSGLNKKPILNKSLRKYLNHILKKNLRNLKNLLFNKFPTVIAPMLTLTLISWD